MRWLTAIAKSIPSRSSSASHAENTRTLSASARTDDDEMNGLIERAIPIRKPHNKSDLAGGSAFYIDDSRCERWTIVA